MSYYDDNFGQWDMSSSEDRKFYRTAQRRSVHKVCVDCGRTVRIMPQYEVCSPCADRRENGGW